MKSLIETSKQN